MRSVGSTPPRGFLSTRPDANIVAEQVGLRLAPLAQASQRASGYRLAMTPPRHLLATSAQPAMDARIRKVSPGSWESYLPTHCPTPNDPPAPSAHTPLLVDGLAGDRGSSHLIKVLIGGDFTLPVCTRRRGK